jgi:hypothetical protein
MMYAVHTGNSEVVYQLELYTRMLEWPLFIKGFAFMPHTLLFCGGKFSWAVSLDETVLFYILYFFKCYNM